MLARKGKARAFQHRCKKRGSGMSAVRQACAFAGITISKIVDVSSLKLANSASVAFIFACVANKRTRCSNARPRREAELLPLPPTLLGTLSL